MQLLFMKPAYKLFQVSSKLRELLSGYHASWVIEEWNDAEFRVLVLPAWKLGFYIFEIKE